MLSRFTIAVLGVLVMAVGAAALTQAGPPTIVVDPDRRHQTMTGWEVTARVWEFDKANDRFDGRWMAHRTALARALAEDAGINRIRLELMSGAENPEPWWDAYQSGALGYRASRAHYYDKVNDNDDPMVADPGGFDFAQLDFKVREMVLPLKAALEARGERLYINLCYVDFRWTDQQGTLDHAANPEEYAELIVTAFVHLRERWGIIPDGFEVILEPENTNGWTPEAIGRALVAAHRRLAAEGFTPEIIVPATTWAMNAPRYFDGIMAVPGAAGLVSVLAYHRYDRGAARFALPTIRARAREAGVRVEMLEYVRGDDALLFEDLRIADASAWQLYSIAVPLEAPRDPGRPTYDVMLEAVYGGGPEPEFLLSKRGRMLSQVFRHVRAGDVRIGAQSMALSVEPVAFESPGGAVTVAARVGQAGPVVIEGLPEGRYSATFTGEDLTRTPVRFDPAARTVEVPGRGIVTVFPAR